MFEPKFLTLNNFKHLKHSKVDDNKYLVIGLTVSEIYIDEDERIHRDNDKAAMYDYRTIKDKLSLISKKWYKHGLNHRKDGPAEIGYDRAGRIRSQKYKLNGITHRPDGPAIINYDKKGKILTRHFIFNGSLYSSRVLYWYDKNNFDSWKDMNEDDFNRMWMELV